jgi:hypothetical protein
MPNLVPAVHGDNRVVNLGPVVPSIEVMHAGVFLPSIAHSHRRIAPFPVSEKVNGKKLPFASAVLYSVGPLPLASLGCSILREQRKLPFAFGMEPATGG